MDWSEHEGIWVSGPYTIRLVEPELWVMARHSDESGGSRIEVDGGEWTGRSLHAMKQRAEEIEANVHRVQDRNRHLAIAVLSAVVFASVAGGSGPLAAIVAVAAAAGAIYGMVRSFDLTIHRRPWDNISESYQ